MARIFSEAERAGLVRKITDLIATTGRATLAQLEGEFGISQPTARHYLSIVVELNGFYRSGAFGVFPSHAHFLKWRETRAEQSLVRAVQKAKTKTERTPVQAPLGKVTPYDRNTNMVCDECRNSPRMRQLLAFFRPEVRRETV
ncbi:DUF977 family protein [Citrobacter portucalensis]|uniref:DUF977 family protein n=1 Tax=Citrobacter portucalensis TaxID=1639133 RepID=UPI00226B0338|nr:DUF977 family protein [Citrobacter portucalensis]MCX8984821.1 DUF977 family protein [Citrobacter portucalensis]